MAEIDANPESKIHGVALGAGLAILALIASRALADDLPTTRPLLEQLNRETQALFKDVAPSIVRVQLPLPTNLALTPDNPLSKWTNRLDPDSLRRLEKNVGNAPLEVRAFLAQTTIRLNDLLTLGVGDLITTDKEFTEEVLIQVEGKKKFLAEVGQFRGKRAIKLTHILRQAEVPAEKAVTGKAVTGAAG